MYVIGLRIGIGIKTRGAWGSLLGRTSSVEYHQDIRRHCDASRHYRSNMSLWVNVVALRLV